MFLNFTQGNGCKSYSIIVAKIHELLHTVTNMGKLIKIQRIPLHIIPENNIADKMTKMVCNWQNIWEFLLEYEDSISNLRSDLHSYKLDIWEQAKSSLKIGDYISNIYD